MTSRCYFTLIRAQQEEGWPCSILLPRSLARTQVSNCQMLDIPQISSPAECRERKLSHGLLMVFSKWPFWSSLLTHLLPPMVVYEDGHLITPNNAGRPSAHTANVVVITSAEKTLSEVPSGSYHGWIWIERDGKTEEFTLPSISYVRVPLQIKCLKTMTLKFSFPKPSKNHTEPNVWREISFP